MREYYIRLFQDCLVRELNQEYYMVHLALRVQDLLMEICIADIY